MSYVFLNNDLSTWATALCITVAVFAVLLLARRVIVSRLHAFANGTETYLDDVLLEVLNATNAIVMLLASAYAGAQWLSLTERASFLMVHGAIAVLLLQAARWGDAGIGAWLHHYRRTRSSEDAASTTSTAALGFVARTILWLVAVLMILDNFGVNITTLVASLGIGGIAVALALQNVLGDLFSSLSIVLDKPFVIGDFITVDTLVGTVEYVGLKTTRIRSLGGELIVMSNSDILKSRIRNYQHMEMRRIVFGIGVTHEISKDKLAVIPTLLRESVEAVALAKFDRAHFAAFKPSSLDFEIVFFVRSAEYGVYMQVQHEVNMGIFERFQAHDIALARPTQVVRVAQEERARRAGDDWQVAHEDARVHRA